MAFSDLKFIPIQMSDSKTDFEDFTEKVKDLLFFKRTGSIGIAVIYWLAKRLICSLAYYQDDTTYGWIYLDKFRMKVDANGRFRVESLQGGWAHSEDSSWSAMVYDSPSTFTSIVEKVLSREAEVFKSIGMRDLEACMAAGMMWCSRPQQSEVIDPLAKRISI